MFFFFRLIFIELDIISLKFKRMIEGRFTNRWYTERIGHVLTVLLTLPVVVFWLSLLLLQSWERIIIASLAQISGIMYNVSLNLEETLWKFLIIYSSSFLSYYIILRTFD